MCTAISDWRHVSLGELITDIRYGTSEMSNNQNKGIPVLRIPNVIDGKINTSDLRYIESDTDEFEKYKVENNDIIIVRTNANPEYIGRCALYTGDSNSFLFASYLLRIKVESKLVTPVFLTHYLQSDTIRRRITSLAHTSAGNYNINIQDVKSLTISLPSLGEQEKINKILQQADNNIETAGRVIEEISVSKRGLMQHLLTRGIGHTRFKQTRIGEIPENWEIFRVSEIGKIVTGTTPSTNNSEFYNGKYVWVRPGDLGNTKYIAKSEKMLSIKGFNVSRKLPKNSVLVTCIGATIGKMGLAAVDLATNQQINSVICNSKCNPHYLYYYLAANIHRIRRLAGTTAVPIVNKSDFGRINVPIPEIEEQEKISRILSLVDENIEIGMKQQIKLVTLKKGLMQVLLTGKVRVKT